MIGGNKIPDGTQQITAAKPGQSRNTAAHLHREHNKHNFDFASRFKGFKLADKIGEFMRGG